MEDSQDTSNYLGVESNDSNDIKSEDEIIPEKKRRTVGRPRKYPKEVSKIKGGTPKKRGRPLGSKKMSLNEHIKKTLKRKSNPNLSRTIAKRNKNKNSRFKKQSFLGSPYLICLSPPSRGYKKQQGYFSEAPIFPKIETTQCNFENQSTSNKYRQKRTSNTMPKELLKKLNGSSKKISGDNNTSQFIKTEPLEEEMPNFDSQLICVNEENAERMEDINPSKGFSVPVNIPQPKRVRKTQKYLEDKSNIKGLIPKKRGRPFGTFKKKVNANNLRPINKNISPSLNLRKRNSSGSVVSNNKVRCAPEFLRPSQDDKCDICMESGNLLCCTDCCYRAHTSCLRPELRKHNSRDWKCMYCSECSFCDKPKSDANVVCCDQCGSCYHLNCVLPNIEELEPTDKWVCCNNATPNKVSSSENLTSRYGYPASNLSTSQLTRIMYYYPKRVPDCKEWTCNDVRNFIERIGFPNEGQHFWEENVDGRALLLLRRKDVLQTLHEIIGHALKIYINVECLQRGFSNQ